MGTATAATAIGFSGAPREYTGIVMQRNRQKQLDEQAGKEKKDKEFDKLYEQINIKDPTKFFSFDLQDIKRTTAETIDKLAKAKASGNYAEAQKITSDYNTTIGSYQQQKQDFDVNVKTGKNIYDPSLINFENAKTRDEAARTYADKEGVVSENNQFRFKAIPNYDDQKLFTDVARDPNVFMEDTPETIKDSYGNMMRVNKFKINQQAFDARLANAIQDPQIFAAEAAKYRIKNPKWREQSDLEFQQNVVTDFMDRGRSFAGIPTSKERNVGGIKISNVFNAGAGDQQDKGDLGGISNVRLKFKGELSGNPFTIDYDVPTKAIGALKDIKGTYPTTISMIDYKTGQPIVKLGVTEGTYNTSFVAPVLYEDINIGGVKLKKGLIVNAEKLEQIQKGLSKIIYEKGNVKPGLVSFGKLDDGKEVYRTAEMSDQTQETALGKEDSPKYEELERQRKEVIDEINNEISKVKSKPATQTKVATQSKPAAQTKPAASKKPTGETKTREERIKANPKLNNLPK